MTPARRRHRSWDPGETFDRALQDSDGPAVLTGNIVATENQVLVAGEGCDRGPCIRENSICGDFGNCEKTKGFLRCDPDD